MEQTLLDPAVLKGLAAVHTVWLSITTGAALALYIFSIPVIKTSTSVPSGVMLQQFHHLITLGIRYMQTNSRIQVVSLAVLSMLFYGHPDPDVEGTWKYYAAALLVCLQAIWYEVVFIFPTNDRLVAMKGDLLKTDEEDADFKARPEVLRLLETWRTWHIGRIMVPLTAACLAAAGLLD